MPSTKLKAIRLVSRNSEKLRFCSVEYQAKTEVCSGVNPKKTNKVKVATRARHSERNHTDKPTRNPPNKLGSQPLLAVSGRKKAITIPKNPKVTARVCSQYMALYRVKGEAKIKITNPKRPPQLSREKAGIALEKLSHNTQIDRSGIK